MTHCILRINGQLVFDGNMRLLDEIELKSLLFNTVAEQPNSEVQVEITVYEKTKEKVVEKEA